MAEFKDAVKDTTTTTGTGTITLNATAFPGYQTPATAHTASATVQYRIENDAKTEWENGEGALNAGKTSLSRTTVTASSNSNALVNFSAGTKTVYTTVISRNLNVISNLLANKSIPFSDSTGKFNESANFTYDSTTNLLMIKDAASLTRSPLTTGDLAILTPWIGRDNNLMFHPYIKDLYHDILSFNTWWGTPLFERYYSAAWHTATLDNTIFSQISSNVLAIDTGSTACRWTWNNANVGYSLCFWWSIGILWDSTGQSKSFLIEESTDGSSWTTIHSSSGNDSSACNFLIWANVSNTGTLYMRFTISVATTGAGVSVSELRAYTAFNSSAGGGRYLEYPYIWDADRNVTFPAKVGFNNTTAITKPTVTGSKGGNAALASLLTALANYGLITDSST